MGALTKIRDGLLNAITGVGTTSDPRTASRYALCPLTPHDIESAYRASGMMRKVIDIPAEDSVRAWRDFRGEDIGIEEIEAEERRLELKARVYEAEIMRGLGGGAIIIGAPGLPETEIFKAMAKGAIAYLKVVSRWQLQLGPFETDPASVNYDKPQWFSIMSGGRQMRLHPSRVACFKGDPIPNLGMTNQEDAFWGESRVQRMIDAVKNSDTAQAGFSALVHKARVLRVGIPGLSEMVATQEGETILTKRLAAMAMGESLHNVTIYDSGDGDKGGETIEQHQVNWDGMKDLMDAFDMRVAALSDIPVTRLLGRAAEGMNASGKSQQQDWHKSVASRQELRLRPCLNQIDAALVPSATGKPAPADLWYDFCPLDEPDQKQEAEIFKAMADASKIIAELNIMPDRALSEGVQSMLINRGWLPALESALSAIPEAERFGDMPDAPHDLNDPNAPDPSALQAGSGMNDASPRSLYVSRKLLNASDLIEWAKEQGFVSTLAAEDMHVTITYSRTPVDWMAMGDNWSDNGEGGLTVAAGGARVVEPLGDRGAVVLLFSSSAISWRHEDMVRNGASHDFGQYQPHVTITYEKPDDLDLSNVEPFRGVLEFGPEIFEEIDPDWTPKVSA